MQVTPVRQVVSPRYPTRQALLAEPGGVGRFLPVAWRFPGALASALAVFVATQVAGCADSSAPRSGLREAQVDRNIEAAGDWTRSIYGSQQPLILMGDIATPPPALIEEEVESNLENAP